MPESESYLDGSQLFNFKTHDGQDPVYADAELAEPEVVHYTATEAAATPLAQPRPAKVASNGQGKGISLRTRSMADVLAEQGDFAGAIEIYSELEGQAKSGEELADLKQKISTLRHQQQAGYVPPKPEKSGVINLLEALSERLEARAQN